MRTDFSAVSSRCVTFSLVLGALGRIAARAVLPMYKCYGIVRRMNWDCFYVGVVASPEHSVIPICSWSVLDEHAMLSYT